MRFPRRRREERGSTALEFALIVPLFLVLLFGVIQYSMYFLSEQSGSSAARMAARRAAVGDLTCAQLNSMVQANVVMQNATPTVTRKYYDPTIYPITDATTARTDAQIQAGDNVRVVVSYPSFDIDFPMVPVPGRNGTRLLVYEYAVARVETVNTTNTKTCP